MGVSGKIAFSSVRSLCFVAGVLFLLAACGKKAPPTLPALEKSISSPIYSGARGLSHSWTYYFRNRPLPLDTESPLFSEIVLK